MGRRPVSRGLPFRLLLLGLAFALVPLIGCSSKLDPTEPGEAYLMYRKAMLDGDVEGIWKRTAPSTKQYFEDRYQQLVKMEEKIEKYLPQSDHEVARKQTGTVLLDEIDGARGLFEKVTEPSNVSVSQARRLGSLVQKIRKSKDKERAQVVTRSGRTYRMVKDDGEWYVALEKSMEALDKSFEWLDRNREALTETVNDLLESEKEKREEVIAELMDVEEK